MDLNELFARIDATIPHKDKHYVSPTPDSPTTINNSEGYTPPQKDELDDVSPVDLSFDIDFDEDEDEDIDTMTSPTDDTLFEDPTPPYSETPPPFTFGEEPTENDTPGEEEPSPNSTATASPANEEQKINGFTQEELIAALQQLGVTLPDTTTPATPNMTTQSDTTPVKKHFWQRPKKESRLNKYRALAQQTTNKPIIIGVTSFKGGVGKTTIATALGILSGQTRGKRSIVIDADFHGGAAERATGEIVTDISAASTLLHHNPNLGVKNFITEGDHCDFVAAPQDITSGPVSAEGISRVVNATIKDGYTFIILDLPIATIGAWWEKVISLCTNLIMVSDTTIDSVSRLPETLDWIDLIKADTLKPYTTLTITHSSKEKNAINITEWIKKAHQQWKMEAVEIPYDKVLHNGKNIHATNIDPTTIQQLIVIIAVVVQQKIRKEKVN